MNSKITRYAATVLLLITVVCLSVLPSFAAYPAHTGDVVDEAGVISESTINQLTKTNESIEESTGCRISICTVTDTDGLEPLEYGRNLFTEWELGEGILILIVYDGDTKSDFCLIPSTTIEDIISYDTFVSIGEDCISPDFQSGNIDRSMIRAISKISTVLISSINTTDETEETQETEEESSAGAAIGRFFKKLLTIIIILLIIAIIGAALVMFNDDVNSFYKTYILRQKPEFKMDDDQYDERLYGSSVQRSAQGSRSNNSQRNAQNANRGQYYQNGNTQNRAYNGQRNTNGAQYNGNSYGNAQRRVNNQYNGNAQYNGNGQRTVNGQRTTVNGQSNGNTQRVSTNNSVANGMNQNTADDNGFTRTFNPNAVANAQNGYQASNTRQRNSTNYR